MNCTKCSLLTPFYLDRCSCLTISILHFTQNPSADDFTLPPTKLVTKQHQKCIVPAFVFLVRWLIPTEPITHSDCTFVYA